MAMTIMIQGTMSNVGKSLITAGLCRIFTRDGYRAAPFKSQNMALNSFITREGLEIGRAQAMQAEAAGIEPSVLMNPILLKPSSDTGSQIILNGEAVGNMSAVEYYRNKKKFIPQIMKSFNALSEKYDIIVIEGAGSPAEINLKENDIVNMGMAKMVQAPVLLAGDIDRGGVFAQLLGTINLLDNDEKDYVKGMIINKFRGDKSILQSGLDMLEEKSEKPVIGVVPYVHLDIDDEDSLSERFRKKKNTGLADIAVIKLPRISNFTDFDIFDRIEGVSLRYVKYADELGNPDLIIIPGTKSTIDDLLYIRENGLEAKIKRFASIGKPVFGICGGFQMLGNLIIDYDGTEKKGELRGMELLPVKTVFRKRKTRTRVDGVFKNVGGIFESLNGEKFRGYEIHNGISEITDNTANMNVLFSENEKKADGVCKGNIYGTYVHGIFDGENVVRAIISAIFDIKGISTQNIKDFNVAEYKKMQYDRLADTIRDNMDMEMVYKIMKEGI